MPEIAKMMLQCLLVFVFISTSHAHRIFVHHLAGGSSHLMELLQVTQVLASRGHHIIYALEDWEVAGFKNKGILRNENYSLIINKAYSTPEEGQMKFTASKNTFASLAKNPVAALKFSIGKLADDCRRFVTNEETSKAVQQAQPDLILADVTHACGVIIADMYKKPYVLFSPTSLFEPLTTAFVGVNLPPSTFPQYSTSMTHKVTFMQRMVNFALYHFIARFMTPAMLQNNLRRELNVTTRTTLADARLFLINADFAVEYPVSLPPYFKFIGPLLAAPPQPLPKDIETFLKTGREGAIYASFGSVFVFDKATEVATFAAALNNIANAGYSVLWRITSEELPPGAQLETLKLHPNVHTSPWAPQNDVLGCPSVKAFIAHGGTNSVYESAYHGVPIVNIPFIADHMDHAAKAAFRGFGITVDRAFLTKGDHVPLVKAVLTIGNSSKYQRAAQNVGRLMRARSQTPPERAAEWIIYALSMPDNESVDLRGVSGELSWMALHSVDVGVAWLAVLGVVLLALYTLIRMVLKGARAVVRIAKSKEE